MGEATTAWTSMGYGEGLLFTLWVVSLYYIKCQLDNHFAQKRKFFWADGLKKTMKEALREWEDEVEYLGTPSKKSRS